MDTGGSTGAPVALGIADAAALGDATADAFGSADATTAAPELADAAGSTAVAVGAPSGFVVSTTTGWYGG